MLLFIKLKKKILIIFLSLFSFVSKAQYLQTSNVINISCYENGQIQTTISSLDTNHFSKWYYSNDSINWIFINNNDNSFILNNSSYNSDSILTSVCGYFKLNIVNILDSILDENIFNISCDITSQISKDLIVCNEDFGAVYIDTIYGGVPPYTNSWYYNTNFIENDVSFLDSLDFGLYTIIITDSIFCTDTVNAFLNNPPNFEININEINQIGCYGDSTGSIIFSFSGGRKISYYNNYNYYLLHVNDTIREYSINNLTTNIQSISTQQSLSSLVPDTIEITNLFSDTFRLIVSDSSICIFDTSIFINQADSYSLYSQHNNILEKCSSDTIWYVIDSISGGNLPFMYSIYNSNYKTTISSFINDSIFLPSGEYFIVINDTVFSCLDSLFFSINSVYDVAVDLDINHINCFGDSTGYINIDSIYGGLGPYNINWNTHYLDDLSYGSYYLEIIDSNNCIFKDSIYIDEPNQYDVNIFVDSITCYGDSNGSISLNITGSTAPYQVLWNNLYMTDSLINLASGVYNFLITDSNNCLYNDSILLPEPENIVIDFINYQDSLLCFGDSTFIEINISGYDSLYSVLWSNGSVNSNTYLFSGLAYCTISDYNNCITTDSVYISQPLLLDLENIIIIDTTCNDGVIANPIILGGTYPFNFIWSTGDVDSAIIVNDTLNNLTLTVEDFCGFSDSFTTNIDPFILETEINYDDSLFLAEVNISNSSSSGSFSYLWSNLRSDSLSNDSIIYVNACEKKYFVVVTNLNNDCFIIDTLDLSSFLPDSLINFENTSVIADSMLWGYGPYTYFWSTGENTSSVKICPGQYWVEVTDNSYGINGEGCMKRQDFVIEDLIINLQPKGLFVECDLNSKNIDLEAIVNGGTPNYSFNWSFGSTQNPIDIILSPGYYSLQVKDKNDCIVDTNFTIQALNSECIPNFFSPNGDNINDTWKIDQLFLFENSEISIFGRFGRKIFSSVGYSVPWNGKNKNGIDVPEGVYFYVIDLNNGLGKIKGSVNLLR